MGGGAENGERPLRRSLRRVKQWCQDHRHDALKECDRCSDGIPRANNGLFEPPLTVEPANQLLKAALQSQIAGFAPRLTSSLRNVTAGQLPKPHRAAA